MRTIKLYGNLGKKFGKVHKYDVRTPAEAVRALIANYPKLEAEILDKKYVGYKIIVGNEDRSEVEALKYPADADIKIIPIIQGAGGNWGMIVAGIVLIAVAWWNPLGWGAVGCTAAELAAGELAIGAMYAVGTALVLGGISNLLFSPTAPTSRDAEEQITSKYFNGPVNLTTQGNPVPLVYGRMRVGSQVISAGLLTYRE